MHLITKPQFRLDLQPLTLCEAGSGCESSSCISSSSLPFQRGHVYSVCVQLLLVMSGIRIIVLLHIDTFVL